MPTSVSARAPAWVDGVQVSGAEMRAAILPGVYSGAGVVRGLQVVQIPTPAMQIRVPAGLSIVDDGQNGYLPLELAAQTDLDIAASSLTNPRIDSLIAEFVDDGGSSLYRYRILTGTPTGSPVAPSLPPADQPTAKTLRLRNIAVAASATTITNANISLVAGSAPRFGRATARKTANESVTNSAVLQDDDHLVFTVAAGVYYQLSGYLIYGAHKDGDISVGFSGPANATLDWALVSKGTGEADGAAGIPFHDNFGIGQSAASGGWQSDNTSKLRMRVDGLLYGGDGGTFRLRFCQRASHATATILYTGSYLVLEGGA